MEQLYQNIKMKREELGMSQEELAKKLNYKSRSSINKIELGVNDLPQSKIAEFAIALDTTVAELMGWENGQVAKKQFDKWEKKYNQNGRLADDVTRIENLSRKDEKDIAKKILSTLEQLSDKNEALMFDGEPLDDESRELLKSSLENSIRMGKVIAKKKYTPKKFRN